MAWGTLYLGVVGKLAPGILGRDFLKQNDLGLGWLMGRRFINYQHHLGACYTNEVREDARGWKKEQRSWTHKDWRLQMFWQKKNKKALQLAINIHPKIQKWPGFVEVEGHGYLFVGICCFLDLVMASKIKRKWRSLKDPLDPINMVFLRYEAVIVITGIGGLGGSNLNVLIFPKDPGVS